jgi:hypothetical protein
MYYQDLGDVAMDERRQKLTGRLQEGIASSFHPTAAINEIICVAIILRRAGQKCWPSFFGQAECALLRR